MKKLVVFGIALLMLLSTAGAQERKIELKKTFWSGWKYSIDGSDYKKVGMSGKDLVNEMQGNQPAIDEMNTYRSRMTFGMITGGIGGFLIGWPLGATLGGDDWNDTYTIMIVSGGVFCTVSMISGASGTKHLKEAVRLYNGEDQALGFDLKYQPSRDDNNADIMVGLVYFF